MIWIWKVLTTNELSECKIAAENSKIEYHIKKNLPRFLSKSAASMIDAQISRVTTTKTAAAVIRQYIIGDGRVGPTENCRKREERIANYIMSSDEFEHSIIDLRENNGTKQRFDEWFNVANEYIANIETKCHDRRHDAVERLTTWISVNHFIGEVRGYFDLKYKDDVENLENFPRQPSEDTVLNSFLDSNPYVGKTFHHGRLNICKMIQKRSAHIEHIDTHYCHAQRRILKEMQIELLHLY